MNHYQKTTAGLRLESWLDSLAQEAKPDIDECIQMLGSQIEWLHDLKRTHQDPEWHAEGNVHIHTNMVLSELYKLLDSDAAHIRGSKRQALILSALLHDIGKTVRTKEVEINGVLRVACPQHEAIGRSYLTFKLLDVGIAFKVVWDVLGLVGEHHMPKLLVVKGLDKGDYLALSRRADLEMLYWLEVADMLGRDCPDKEVQIGYLEEFKMFAEEYGVWERPHELGDSISGLLSSESKDARAYIHSHALYEIENGLITMPEEAIARAYSSKDNYSNLFLLCGPSGSGKSTWIEKNCEDFNLVSLDEIREEINGVRTCQKNKGQVLQIAKERLKESLRKKQDVVWDATNLRTDFRKIVCDLGRDYKALVTMVIFLIPEKVLFASNKSREFAVPDEVLIQQLENYQFPVVGEAHRMCFVGEKGKFLRREGYIHNCDNRENLGRI